MARKMPPFMGKETPAEERKEMKIKKMSPAMYKMGEKAEGVHGKKGKMKFEEGGDVPEGGRFDSDTYKRARDSVLQKQIDEQFPAKYDDGVKRKSAPKPAPRMASPAPAPAPAPTPAPAARRAEDMSVSERLKAAREGARTSNTGTDTRSVSERLKKAFGFSKGGSVSASRRADGIAQRGKTKGAMR